MNTNHISWIVPGYLFLCFTISGCFTPKELNTGSIPAIKNFDLKRYLDMWYNEARLLQSFEHALDRVTATYTFLEQST
jgi:lipocalin